ncbi:MAG: fluoride efflux transporter CrcB [Opitutales bacterium]
MRLIWIALGSAIGGTLRYALDQFVSGLSADALPVSTFIINLSGSLWIGYLSGLWAGPTARYADKWHFWITGVCGGYTTFSAFSWELIQLVQEGHSQLAGFYAAASVMCGLFAVWMGVSLALRRQRGGRS